METCTFCGGAGWYPPQEPGDDPYGASCIYCGGTGMVHRDEDDDYQTAWANDRIAARIERLCDFGRYS